MSISFSAEQGTPSVNFATDFEMPPRPGSPPSEAAEYLLEVDMGGLFSWTDGAPLPPRKLKILCEFLGFNWKSVSPLFRGMRATEFSKRMEAPNFSVSSGGITINESLVERLIECGSLPMCPRSLTGWDLHNFANHYSVVGPCNKPWCPRCGVKKLETIIAHLKRVCGPLDRVFTAVAKHDPRLASRMGSRRSDHNAEMFWYRRSDGMVAYVSTEPLGGTKPPQEWIERAPEEAIEWLLTDVMTFPNFRDRGWSDAWRPVGEESDSSKLGGFSDSSFRHFVLDEEQAQVVEDRLTEKVREQFDVELDVVPTKYRHDVEEMLVALVDELHRIGAGGA